MTMAESRGVAYWRARARALEAANRRLHDRLAALALHLPPEYLDELELGAPQGRRRPVPSVLSPGEDGPHLTPADVESELGALWTRTARPGAD